MTWLERKDNWIPSRESSFRHRRDQPVEKSYSVSQVAEICSVTRQTVFKWLDVDEDTGESLIPPHGWYRLPGSGQIRIREWVIKKLQEGMS